MKKIIFILIVGLFICGCETDELEKIFTEKQHTYKTIVMESPEGRLKVTFEYDTDDELKYLNLYWYSIMDFQERVPTNKTINIKTYIAGLGYKGSHGFTGSTPYYPPFDLLNLKNILSSFPEFSKLNHIILDKEAILLLNPDYIFIDSNGLNIIKMDIIRNKAYYRLLKAVKNNHVYSLLPHNNYTTNIENALINTYFIGKTIYPDKFSDIDLEKKANEIYQFFIGKYIFSEMQQNGIGCKRLFFDPDCIAW